MHGFKNSAERDLTRYEFIELMVRIANMKFKKPGICSTYAASFDKLMKEHIQPYSKWMDGDEFRKQKCYDVKVNEVLKKNEI